MRKGCFVCGVTLAFFGLVLFVLLPVVNWVVYPWLEKLVILKYTDLKPENTDVWNAWVSDCHKIKKIIYVCIIVIKLHSCRLSHQKRFRYIWIT